MTLISLAAAWLGGILLAHATRVVLPVWWVAAALSFTALLAARERPRLRLAAGCGLMLALGAARYAASVPRFDETSVASHNDQGFVTLEGVIDDRPDLRDTHVNLEVEADSLLPEEGEALAVEGRVLVQAPRGQEYRYGDRVRVRGKLETPAESEGFSYREFLAREGVYSMVRYAGVEVTGGGGGSPLRAAMIAFRERAHDAIGRLLPDPQAALLSGILLGIESRISPEVREAFNAVGATHVIAISGSNLVILAGIIQSIAARIVKRPGWVAGMTIVGIVSYSIFVGGDAAVTRAAIMTSLALVATQLGRQTYGLASLGFAAVLMSLLNPLVLWDVGFQLSFLATLGLILYVEPLQGLLQRGLERWFAEETAQKVVGSVSDAFLVTLAAQITTTPIMAYAFGRFSLLSLPANFLIIPAQTPLMVLGGLAVLASLVWWPLGQVFAWGSWLFLTWTVSIVRFFAGLPHASLDVDSIPPLVVWGVYGLMFGLTLAARQSPGARERLLGGLRRALGTKLLAGVGVAIAALLFSAAWAMPDGRLHVTFVDVGEGSATLIETPGGRQVLVDAGGSGRRLRTALGDALPFWDRRLDLLILTQPGRAQTAALPDVLARYRFDAVLHGGVEPLPPELLRQSPQVIAARPGTTIRVGDGVSLTVLAAPAEGQSDGGIVLRLEYGDVRVLLPGDLAAQAESALVASGADLHAAVLQVPRSGHREACGEALLRAASPQVAVLSVDAGNRFGLPHAETLERLQAAGVALYRTDRDGTVRVASDGAQLWVKTAR